jgi:DNA-binding response OmpR family regulator
MREMAAKGQPYDIAILDMCMPEMNGLQLAQEVSSDSALSSTRMVMLTSVQVDVAALRRAGVGEWLKKPVRSSELYERLTRLVTTEGTKDP